MSHVRDGLERRSAAHRKVNLEWLAKVLRESGWSNGPDLSSPLASPRGPCRTHATCAYLLRSNLPPSRGKLVCKTPFLLALVPASIVMRRTYGFDGGGSRRSCRPCERGQRRRWDGLQRPDAVGSGRTTRCRWEGGRRAPSFRAWGHRCPRVRRRTRSPRPRVSRLRGDAGERASLRGWMRCWRRRRASL